MKNKTIRILFFAFWPRLILAALLGFLAFGATMIQLSDEEAALKASMKVKETKLDCDKVETRKDGNYCLEYVK